MHSFVPSKRNIILFIFIMISCFVLHLYMKENVLKKNHIFRECSGKNLVIREDISMDSLEQQLPYVLPGGVYSPKECHSMERVAIIIPFRDREQHLRIWLRNMHPFLIRQEINYRIYVIEQTQTGLFNRGKLLNIGFVNALKDGYNCFILQDVDTIPECDYNYYRCENQPIHLSVLIEKFDYKLPYGGYFSGAIALSKQQFQDANGFSNNYHGWGGEDDDFGSRLRLSGMKTNHRPKNISRFSSLAHKNNYEEKSTGKNRKYFSSAHKLYLRNQAYKSEGLNTLEYNITEYKEFKLYTRLTVSL